MYEFNCNSRMNYNLTYISILIIDIMLYSSTYLGVGMIPICYRCIVFTANFNIIINNIKFNINVLQLTIYYVLISYSN